MLKKKNERTAKRVSRKKNPGSAKHGASGRELMGFQRERFATDLISARHAKGETQRDTGGAVGISSAGLTFIENNKVAPSMDSFVKLVRHFKMNALDYL